MILCFVGANLVRKVIFIIGFLVGALFAYLCLNKFNASFFFVFKREKKIKYKMQNAITQMNKQQNVSSIFVLFITQKKKKKKTHPHLHSLQYTYCGIGIVTGGISWYVYTSAIFVTGVISGVIFGQLIWHTFNSMLAPSPNNSYYDLGFVLVSGLGFGLLAFKLEEFVMKALTAFAGSFMVVSGASFSSWLFTFYTFLYKYNLLLT
ncbi:hypothetical protein RFI_19353 [Reticulomyxa filosa]|uniref:Transmembrane protein 198 n=1 Tax=Reticulomyxa filosa TaxID=46433 RepID=X6MY03_RETFI|nr:hypothetical protein RFI_19353 [Reticulomyxa filosa]|eukprot:ETO17955.1 hypothetical protein RFI_19353 [Reticulomyxa filosa]